MPSKYIPRQEQALANWSRNFSALLSADPVAYGVSPAQAAQVATLVEGSGSALTRATDPGTATRPAVAEKNDKRIAMLEVVRPLAQVIKRNSTISDKAKVGLGLVLDPAVRSRLAAPATTSVLYPGQSASRRHILRFGDSANLHRRAKPAGSIGLALFVAVGPQQARGPAEAQFKALVTDQPYAVDLDSAAVSQTATYFGRWYNAAGQLGPWSSPVALTVV